MKVLQLVPLISPNNEYGGPTTVAFGQCRALQQAGHDVILAAGTWGFSSPPSTLDGVRLALFPAKALLPKSTLGGLIAPSMAPWLRRSARDADVVHVHLARDLLTLPAAYWCSRRGIPFVVQTHGMVTESTNLLAPPLDAILTRRVMNSAVSVFYLTQAERRSLMTLFPKAHLEFLRNGITPNPNQDESGVARRDVIYLARIQERKRPLDFVAMARTLAPEFPHTRFRLIGPDEGQGDAVKAAIAATGLGDRLTWDGPLPHAEAMSALGTAAVYVLPSINEPYPMSVLEALARSVPVVITETCGLAEEIRVAQAGHVVAAGAVPVTNAVRELLAEPRLQRRMAAAALHLAMTRLSEDDVVNQLVQTYTAVS